MTKKTLSEAPPGPKLHYSISDFPRAALELSLLAPAMPWISRLGGGRGRPVMVLPGFGADDFSTSILRKILNRWGYDARPWNMGQNLNPAEIIDTRGALQQIEDTLEDLADRLAEINEDTGAKVALIGWSLGGLVARQLAARHPELVSRVITLGTPFGDFRSTVIYPIMQRIRKNEVTMADVDAWIEMGSVEIGSIPLSVIYSDSDGFVPPENATSADSQKIEFIKIRSSHVGLTVNPSVVRLLSDLLRTPAHQWQPYQPALKDRLMFSTTTPAAA